MTFLEFNYMILQGYDFRHLNQSMGVRLQMGGSDQWGNIVTGTELIRRKNGGEAFAFTCPLIKKADGGKFGKTEKGNIWLDADKTTPFQFYQFWLNATDTDATSWIKIFTFLKQEVIAELIEQHEAEPSARVLQKKLAEELTRFVHGQAELDKAMETTSKLFSGNAQPIEEMSETDLENMEGIVKSGFDVAKLETGTDILSFLTETQIFESKGAARKMIQNGGVSLNRIKVSDANMMASKSFLLHNKFILVQVGKKNYFLVECQ
jgi:tyrosyl-tRNA synthetase